MSRNLGQGRSELRVATRVDRNRRGRFVGGHEIFEGRRLHARLPVLVQIAHHVGQSSRVETLLEIDRDDVLVHVNRRDAASGEQTACKFGRRRDCPREVARGVSVHETLVAHAREAAVGFEPHDAGAAARFFDDDNGLTHEFEPSSRAPRRYGSRHRNREEDTVAHPSIEEFQAQALKFLEANAERKAAEKKFVWGEGSDKVSMFEEKDRSSERRDVAKAQEWRQKKYDAGFGWITGPEQFGGRALPGAYQRAYDSVESKFDVPNQSCFTIGLGMVAPTILAHGSDLARQSYLQKMWRGEIIGCQLFSEPGAGSDLASLSTKAERDGDEWIITGQKVWTSGAHYSDIGEIIARTDVNLPKHKGLTGFIVDMKAPGVEIRPLRQMTGGASFNEVFFTEVRVRDDHRLGDVNNGWTVALTTLMNERAAIGAGGGGGGINMFARVIEMAKFYGVPNDPVLRDELANLIIKNRVAAFNNQRALDKIKAGQMPGPEMSMAKLVGTDNMRRMGDFLSHILGAKLVADSGEWGTYAWSQLILGTPGGRIAGGSDEVMRNILAERVLGLPKDPGIDSTSAFKDLKTGTQKA